MYFSGKRYFNQNAPSVVLIKDRPKPPARKKGKLTRKKKAKKKYNFTQLKKQLGNDMIIKLLLRLVEGRANPSKVGRPPKDSKKQYDIYGNEMTRKGRKMRISRGSGIAAPSREKNPPAKKQGERDDAFLKRLEEWLYQNNPYFMYSQNQLKSDLPEKVSGIRTDLNALIQSLKTNPQSVQTTQYETFEEDTFPYQDKSYIERLEKVMKGKSVKVRERDLDAFFQGQEERNQPLSVDDVVELKRVIKLSDEKKEAGRFFGSDKPSRRQAFDKFIRERESEIQEEGFGLPRTGGRRGTPVSRSKAVVKDVPVGITTEQQQRLEKIEKGLEGFESDISLQSLKEPTKAPLPRRTQRDTTERRGSIGGSRERVAETLQTEVRGGTRVVKLGGSRIVPDTSDSETEKEIENIFQREDLSNPLFGGESFRPPTPRTKLEKPKKPIKVAYLPEGGTESSSDENPFKTTGGGTSIDSLLFNLGQGETNIEAKITGGGGKPKIPPREVRVQKLDTSDSELEEYKGARAALTPPPPPPRSDGDFSEEDMLIGVLLGNKAPTQGSDKAIQEITSGIKDIVSGDRYNPLQDFQANLDISSLKNLESVNLLKKSKELDNEIAVLVASAEGGVRLTPQLQKAKDVYDTANAAVATSALETGEKRFKSLEYYEVLKRYEEEARKNYQNVIAKEKSAIDRIYKASVDISDELKRQTGKTTNQIRKEIEEKEEADVVKQIGQLPEEDKEAAILKLDWKTETDFDNKALTAYGGNQEDFETLKRSKTYKTLMKNVGLGKGHKAKTYNQEWFKKELERQQKEETLVRKPRGGQTKLLQQVEVGTTKTELEVIKEKEEQKEQEQIQTLIAEAKSLGKDVDESYVKKFISSSKKVKRPLEDVFISKIKSIIDREQKELQAKQIVEERVKVAKQKLAEQSLEGEIKRIAPNKPLKEYNSPFLSNLGRGTSEANIGQSVFGDNVKRLKKQRQVYLDVVRQDGFTPELVAVINDLNTQLGDPLIEKQPVFRPSTPTRPKIQSNPVFIPESPASVSSGGGVDVIQEPTLTKSQFEDKAKLFSAATLVSEKAGQIGEAAYKHSAKKSADVVGGSLLKSSLRLNKNVADTEEILQQEKSILTQPVKEIQQIPTGKPLPPIIVEDKSSSSGKTIKVKRAKSIKKLPIPPNLKFAKEPPPNFNPSISSSYDDLTIYPPEYRGKYILYVDDRQLSTKGIERKYDIDSEGRSENHPDFDYDTGGNDNERNKNLETADMVSERREKEKAKEAEKRAAIEAKRPKEFKFDEELTKRFRADDLDIFPRTAALYGEGENVRVVDIKDGIPIGFRKNSSDVLEPEAREPESQVITKSDREDIQERKDIQQAKKQSIQLSFDDDFRAKPKSPPKKQTISALGGGSTYGQQQQTQQLLEGLVVPTDVSIEAGLQPAQQLAANPLDTSLAITELPAPPKEDLEAEAQRILGRSSSLLGQQGRATEEEERNINITFE